MRSATAKAIRNARRACELTQQDLGRRLGLTGRAVYRWERGQSEPTKRNGQSLITAIRMLNADAAAQLAAVLASAGLSAPAAAPAQAVPAPLPPPVPSVDVRAVLEHSIFALADELDLPARRARNAVARLLRRLGDANLSFEITRRELEAWIAERAFSASEDGGASEAS
jgi:transcriptional regulator with XRE-family HTH domain